jgi:hypothetical protein
MQNRVEQILQNNGLAVNEFETVMQEDCPSFPEGA